jgi:lysophospholipid acyltransferase (LPLAT)-like uncharacterized protein
LLAILGVVSRDVALAQLTGRPIIPVSWHAQWKIRPDSQGCFEIPPPFSGVELFIDRPIHVPRETTPAERETFRLQLEAALKNISRD